MLRAYDEFVEFIAAGTTPESVVDYQPSDETKFRVADLIRREKTGGLRGWLKPAPARSATDDELYQCRLASARGVTSSTSLRVLLD